MVQGNQPVAGSDKFLFQPQFFLEVFQLGEEVDDVVRDAAQGLDEAQVAFQRGEVGGALHIVEVHHFVFDVEIQLAPQETAEVFVNEVIGAVFGGVGGKVFFQQGAVGLFFGGRAAEEFRPVLLHAARGGNGFFRSA